MESLVQKKYQIITGNCKVITDMDWFGNYIIHKIDDKELHFIGQAKNIEEYLNRFIDFVKERVLERISNINDIKWKINLFNASISIHFLLRNIGKIIEKFIKLELIKKYQHYDYHIINNNNVNFEKTIVIEIINNNEPIFISILSFEHFI